MTSQLLKIVLGSAIVAVLGIAGYIIVRPSRTSVQLTVSALHAKAWGKSWPQSQGTILKTEISDDETGSVDDDDVDGALADILVVPPQFKYRYLKEIRGLKSALGTNPGQDEEDVLVVREEYEMLCQALEENRKCRAFVVTGHPGIGSYESWFSRVES
jgi:hypothetical protein